MLICEGIRSPFSLRVCQPAEQDRPDGHADRFADGAVQGRFGHSVHHVSVDEVDVVLLGEEAGGDQRLVLLQAHAVERPGDPNRARRLSRHRREGGHGIHSDRVSSSLRGGDGPQISMTRRYTH